jgi:hypothetical protein
MRSENEFNSFFPRRKTFLKAMSSPVPESFELDTSKIDTEGASIETRIHPWRTFDFYGEYMWWASSKHRPFRAFPEEIPRAFVLLQECNMGGSYTRIVGYDMKSLTYFTADISARSEEDNRWPFSKELSEMAAGDLVTYAGKYHYHVLDRYSASPFLKVLEWLGLGLAPKVA